MLFMVNWLVGFVFLFFFLFFFFCSLQKRDFFIVKNKLYTGHVGGSCVY